MGGEAALSWATIAWACEHGGDPVRVALGSLATAMRDEIRGAAAPSRSSHAAALARHGRLDAAAQHACAIDAWESLILGALAELVGG